MKVVKAGYEVIEEKDITKKIERIARVCYKSEDKIDVGTDIVMIKKLVERKHLAMLEHASLAYIVTPIVAGCIKEIINLQNYLDETTGAVREYGINRLRITSCYLEGDVERLIVSGNLRAWIEFFEYCKKLDCWISILNQLVDEINKDSKGVIDYTSYVSSNSYGKSSNLYNVECIKDFGMLSNQERMIHETFSILFTVDRGVTHEMVRMRDCSFAQESTRYCNYSNGKYGKEITVVKPCFWEEGSEVYKSWYRACQLAENEYVFMTGTLGIPAQQARDILPTSVKADIVVTAPLYEWQHIFNLRACDATGSAHPQMKEVMVPVLLEMKEKYEFAFGDLKVAE